MDGLSEDFLAPIIAGAFARGVAEAFDLLGVPALFFDRAGHVLFVSASARPYLGDDLRLHSGHVLAKGRANNRTLAAFMADLLRDPSSTDAVTLGTSGLTLSARPVPGGLASSDQLLHAIVVIGHLGATSEQREDRVAAIGEV
jgi:hypothetical protein